MSEGVFDETITYRSGILPVIGNMKILMDGLEKSAMHDDAKKTAIGIIAMADGDEDVLDMLLAYFAEHCTASAELKDATAKHVANQFVIARTSRASSAASERYFLQRAARRAARHRYEREP